MAGSGGGGGGCGGAARQTQTKQKMPHAPFPSQVRRHKRLFIFFFPPSLGNASPQKNVSRKFHREKITNTGSVSCVCGRSAVGSRWTSRRTDCLCRARSPGSALFTGSSYQPSLRCRPAKPSTISPLTRTRAKPNKSKSRLCVFTLQTFAWGSCAQIRSFFFTTPGPNIERENLFKQTRRPRAKSLPKPRHVGDLMLRGSATSSYLNAEKSSKTATMPRLMDPFLL